jgi:hypothetical protein
MLTEDDKRTHAHNTHAQELIVKCSLNLFITTNLVTVISSLVEPCYVESWLVEHFQVAYGGDLEVLHDVENSAARWSF